MLWNTVSAHRLFFFLLPHRLFDRGNLISCDVDHFPTRLVFNILNGPECFSRLGDTPPLVGYLTKNKNERKK